MNYVRMNIFHFRFLLFNLKVFGKIAFTVPLNSLNIFILKRCSFSPSTTVFDNYFLFCIIFSVFEITHNDRKRLKLKT